jgi:hypothetical protein
VLSCNVKHPKERYSSFFQPQKWRASAGHLIDHEGDFEAGIDLLNSAPSGIRKGACGSLMIVVNPQFQLVGRKQARWSEPAILAASALKPNSAAISPMRAGDRPVRDDERLQEAAGACILPLRVKSALLDADRRPSWPCVHTGLLYEFRIGLLAL